MILQMLLCKFCQQIEYDEFVPMSKHCTSYDMELGKTKKEKMKEVKKYLGLSSLDQKQILGIGKWEILSMIIGYMYDSVLTVWYFKVFFFFSLKIRVTTKVRYSAYSYLMHLGWLSCSRTYSWWASRPIFDSGILSLLQIGLIKFSNIQI